MRWRSLRRGRPQVRDQPFKMRKMSRFAAYHSARHAATVDKFEEVMRALSRETVALGKEVGSFRLPARDPDDG